MAAANLAASPALDEKVYRRRIWAWTMYDWANSAFATTILAAVLPVYFSQVAGASLPSAAVATSYWSYGLSLSLLIIALVSPVLGTVSDIIRGKKLFLAVFAGIGIVGTALLVLVSTGDWLLASILALIGRIGFSGANTFYDALLPHVAREEDRDKVSTRGYAMGYLGGGLLLAVNVVMIQLLPGTWGARLSFLSVAIWWAVFSIPLFRHVPEPPAAGRRPHGEAGVLRLSFRRLSETLRDVRRYRELFKFLVAFLIYNDGIGTIIGVAAIYGAEMGFGSVELILALLLVQFVGIPYSLVFGRLPAAGDKRRPFYLAFVLFNLAALPLAGIGLARTLPAGVSGAPPAPFASQNGFFGEGVYRVQEPGYRYSGDWRLLVVPASALNAGQDAAYQQASSPGARLEFPFNGQKVAVMYAMGPDYGIWTAEIDGQPVLDEDTGTPLQVNTYSPTVRYEVEQTLLAPAPGEHTLAIVSTGGKDPDSQGTVMSVSSVQVLPGLRQSSLGMIIGLILALELLGLAFAFLFARLFAPLAAWMDTKRSVQLALLVYSIIAVWGFFLNSVVEFWFLAWMVAMVQGGSQALSRSLFASMSPASESGEFFGLFGIMEKFSAIIGPLLFGLAGTIFGSSRPAVLSLIVLFILGGRLLSLVNVEEGKRVAQAADAEILGTMGVE